MTTSNLEIVLKPVEERKKEGVLVGVMPFSKDEAKYKLTAEVGVG
jgi:hypothetical protein